MVRTTLRKPWAWGETLYRTTASYKQYAWAPLVRHEDFVLHAQALGKTANSALHRLTRLAGPICRPFTDAREDHVHLLRCESKAVQQQTGR